MGTGVYRRSPGLVRRRRWIGTKSAGGGPQNLDRTAADSVTASVVSIASRVVSAISGASSGSTAPGPTRIASVEDDAARDTAETTEPPDIVQGG